MYLLNMVLYFLTQSLKHIDACTARVDPLPTKWRNFDWWTEYSEKNSTEVDALWDAILPSHGFVAMDTGWALGRQWPESMRLPSDSSKSVYLLEAYHQLHCIVRHFVSMPIESPLKLGTENHTKDVLGAV